MGLRIPDPVYPGADIRIISPSMATASYLPERRRRAEKALSDLGFRVSYGVHALTVSSDGITAGSARDRAEDFMAAFADPTVGAVLAADAGTGTAELLEFIDPAPL